MRARLLGLLLCTTILAALLWQQGSQPLPQPAVLWTFEPGRLQGAQLVPEIGQDRLQMLGKPVFAEDKYPGLVLRQLQDGLVLPKTKGNAAWAPRPAFTVSAWARVDRLAQRGGVVSFLTGRQEFRKGLWLGHDYDSFAFGLSAQGADDGFGRFTILKSKSRPEPGRWYHLAASYDGQAMSLYVNGQLEASSQEQSGLPILPWGGGLRVGRYADGDEDAAFQGVLREVRLDSSCLGAGEVAALFDRRKELIDASPADLGPYFEIEPYLQYPTQTSIRVLWETHTPGKSEIRWGTKLPLDGRKALPGEGAFHEALIDGLEPETRYFYQTATTDAAGRTLESKILTFMTAVRDGSAFSFAIIGDTQKNPKIMARLAQLMWDRRPHFILHLGDVVDSGPDRQEWLQELFRPSVELFGRVPIVPTIGNHEKDHAHYYKYFSLPEPEYRYRFRYGNADFFAIDTNKKVPAGSEQYAWLDQELAKSDAPWKLVFHHHPAWSSDDNDFGDTWKERSDQGDLNARSLASLYEKHRVDINLNGHIHLYERSWPIRAGKVDRQQGVIYLTSGGGGGKLENFAPTPTWFKAECRVDFHFCYVTIHGNQLYFKAFDQHGRLFDAFELRK